MSSRSLVSTARTVAKSRSLTPSLRQIRCNSNLSSSSKPASSKFQPPPAPASSSRAPRVGTTFLALTLTGIAVTSYGVYRYYSSFETWPEDIRPDLRAAIKAEQAGEVKVADAKYRHALSLANTLSDEQLGGDGLIKRTGISIALASMLEKYGYPDAAYAVYRDAWTSCLVSTSGDENSLSVQGRSGPERARAAALSSKLGEVAQRIAEQGPAASIEIGDPETPADVALKALRARERRDKPLTDAEVDLVIPAPPPPPLPTRRAAREAAERHLVWSVEELLRLARTDGNGAGLAGGNSPDVPSASSATALADLELPPWVTRMDLLGSIESLGSFYAAQGRAEYAVPLYLQALQLLVPAGPDGKPRSKPGGAPVTVADRCRAAVVLNNLSHTLSESAEAAAKEAASVAEADRSGFSFAKLTRRSESNDGVGTRASEQSQGRSDAARHYAKRGLQLVQETNAKAGWGLASLKEPSPPPLNLVGSEDEERTAVVQRECLQCEAALLLNLAGLAIASGDKCDAREYLQRAWRLAEREGWREARNRAASMLSGLERFGNSSGSK